MIPYDLPDLSMQIKHFIYLAEHPSTNDYAINSLSNNDPKRNTCVYTYNQTMGRGQIGRKWYSGTDKNISCSFRYYLSDFKVKDQFLLNIAFSLAIKDFVSTYVSQKVLIKWPNDIYVNDQKIAGLLIQNMVRSEQISSTILGVGINVNEDNFPAELPNPTSIVMLSKQTQDLLELQLYLADCVRKRMGQPTEQLKEEYLSSLYRIDTASTYLIDGEKQEGIIRGVAEDGKLQLELGGQRRLFSFRELEFII